MFDDEPDQATLTFREQQDGKRVAFLNGKCVIIGREWVHRVSHGERWIVGLRHFETYAIAEPLAKEASGNLHGGSTAPTPPAESAASARAAAALAPPTVAARAASPRSDTRVPVTVDAKPGPTKIQGMTIEPNNVIRRDDRVGFFIDSANIDFATRDLGYFLEWQKALDYFLADGHFSDAYYYVAEYGDDGPQRAFLDRLAQNGFIIRSKPVKVITDEDGKRQYKGNLDIEIALDMVAAADNYDVAYLFSGDSDFKRVVELLQSRGKRVYVVTSRGTASRELLHIASKPVYFLDDFGDVLRR